MPLLDSLIIGVLSGVIASFLFIIIIHIRAPRSLASYKLIINNGMISIKLLNMTWYKSIIDVNVQLSIVRRAYRDVGHIADHKNIKLRANHLFEMYPRKFNSSEGAWIFRSTDLFFDEVNEFDYFRFRVLASEPTFGIRKSFTFDYNKDKIIWGNYDFKSGRSLDIVTPSPKTTTSSPSSQNTH